MSNGDTTSCQNFKEHVPCGCWRWIKLILSWQLMPAWKRQEEYQGGGVLQDKVPSMDEGAGIEYHTFRTMGSDNSCKDMGT